jgi:hypothetical protein
MSTVEVRRSSLSVCALAMIVVSANIWWTSADSHAQEATPAAWGITAGSTSWSVDGRTTDTVPHLVISMADPKPYGPIRIAGDEVANPCASIATYKQAGPAASRNRTEDGGSRALLLTSVSEATTKVHGLTNVPAKHAPWRQTIGISPEQMGTRSYYLVDNGSASGPFLYGHQMSTQLLTENESVTHELAQARSRPSPVLQIEDDGWRLPVLFLVFMAAGSHRR